MEREAFLAARNLILAHGDSSSTEDIAWFARALEKSAPPFDELDPMRQAAIIDLTCLTGLMGIMKITGFWKAVRAQDWQDAAEAIILHAWRPDDMQRASDCATIMRDGSI